MKLPIDAVLAITYRCNARCTMCDIWQIKDHTGELEPGEFLKLPKTLTDINISGGEPFLHPRLTQIIKNIKASCPKAHLIFSSNGFAPELINTKIKEILKIDKNIGVAISIDGLADVHNKVRGIANGFDKAMHTIDLLKQERVKDIKLAFTLTNDNLNQMQKVFDLSRQLKVDFTMSAMQSSDVYFGNKENQLNLNEDKLKSAFKYVIKKQLTGWKFKQWLRAYYSQGLFDFIVKGERDLPIEAGDKHFFMDPTGEIYPSVVDSQSMGNLKNFKNFKDLWCSNPNNKLRTKLKQGLAKKSWMICTARSAIKKHPFRVLVWILKNKLS